METKNKNKLIVPVFLCNESDARNILSLQHKKIICHLMLGCTELRVSNERQCLPICAKQAMATKRIQLLWPLLDTHCTEWMSLKEATKLNLFP